ncbi:hypothetical protein ABFX02_10G171300 [Erythranthe guttata]
MATISGHCLILLLILFFFSFNSLAFSKKCHPNDKKALLQIKKDLNNPYELISWNPTTDCCTWSMVDCDEKTNRITRFDTSDANFGLPIPAAIGDLKYLENLAFHKVNATGQIPESITKLTNLKFLDLRWNSLTGPVPSFLSKLKKLTYIGLSFNSFSGTIPASLSQLPNLGGLRLDRNKLTGSIPESFADFRQQDFYLYLSHNQLTGNIPARLGHANFTWIDVSRNRLEGDISFLLGKNKSLNTADFSRNMFQFDFSKVEFSESLRNLDLNHNRITGRLPEGLAKMGDLISLNVSYNRLCGKIPVGGNLQDFKTTSYSHNKCLCGAPLPKCN